MPLDNLLWFSPVVALWHSWSADAGWSDALALHALSAPAAVLLALAIDRCWGEPPAAVHPVVWMGRCLGWLGKKIAPSQDQTGHIASFIWGSAAWLVLAAIVLIIYGVLQWLVQGLEPWWQVLCMAVLLKPLFAWRMLRSEVLAVEVALNASLEQGRERLSWLVSRQTAQLDAGQVRESAIETLAENLCDSVIAPLFWFALCGLPGVAVYRLANTADAMWGYPAWRGQGSERRYWQWAGKWTARADDVLNWLPARLTAGVLLLVSGNVLSNFSWTAWLRDAHVTPSPNGGWTMGAMAHALRIRLGKPGVYVLNPEGQVPQSPEVERAVALAGRVVGCVAWAAWGVVALAGFQYVF